MHSSDAADLIDEIIASIKTDPAQFHLEIYVIGQQVTSNGGTGMNVSVTGGGPGSIAVGNQVSMSGANIDISRKQGFDGFDQQRNRLLQALAEISYQLRSGAPDKSVIQSILKSFNNTWVPGVIIGVVGNAVSKVIGL